MATYKSPVYATKVNNYYRVVTDESVYLGEITFSSLKEGFLKAIRLYNKNAKRNIASPAFIFRGSVYWVDEYGIPSKNGRGNTWYWELTKVYSKWVKVDMGMATVIGKGGADTDPYSNMKIPKSKINLPNAMKYIEEW